MSYLLKGIKSYILPKKNNKRSINIKKNIIPNKIIEVKKYIIYIFMDDIDIKKLFHDYSVNTNNTIKIEKNSNTINFNIKKIQRIDTEKSSINYNKIKKIEEKLKEIKDNIIIYIKPLKLIKNKILNKNKVDYVFFKNKKNNDIKSKKKILFLQQLSFLYKKKNNPENYSKSINNFDINLKNKIKYFKSEDIFSEIVKIINSSSNSENNIETNSETNSENNFCNVNNKIGYKLENRSSISPNSIDRNYLNTKNRICNNKCREETPIILNFRNENDLKNIQTYLYPIYLSGINLLNIISFNSLNIYKRNTKIRFIEKGVYGYEYKNDKPLITLNKAEDIKKYKLVYVKEKIDKKYYFILTKNNNSNIFYKINILDILYFILIHNRKDVIIILKKCTKLNPK
jgi:hypothetical protein